MGRFVALLAALVAAAGLVAPCQGAAPKSELKARFQGELDAVRQEYKLPGMTAAYVLPDGAAEVAASGFADVERRALMSPRSRILSGSIGKTFAAATALALSQEGKLKLDDPIAVWLGDRPWFARLPNHDAITLRHLLTHSSGLNDHVFMDAFAGDVAKKWREPGNLFPPETLIAYVLDTPALFKPGEGYHYTDTGYLLVGLIIEKASGDSYYSQVTRRFLKPLRLSLTSPSDGPALKGLAPGYQAADNAFGMPAKTMSADGVMVYNPAGEWTGGGLVTNSGDLVVWAKALYEGNAMTGDYLKDLLNSVSMGKGDGRYGAGVYVGPSAYGVTYGHGGWIPGYRSDMRYYPEHRVAVAFQINSDIGLVGDQTPVSAIRERLTAVVLDHVRPN
jgi:D-alanyl-D-alanine carboxypeptidase